MKTYRILLLSGILLVIMFLVFQMRQNHNEGDTDFNMVLVPKGTMSYNSQKAEIPSFYLDIHPVTVQEFRGFIEETGYVTSADEFGDAGVFDFNTGKWGLKVGANWEYPQGKDFPKAIDSHPVTQVSWYDATAYAQWKGKRLPSEMEWEFAARNGGQIVDAMYPWGTNELKDNDRYLANVWQGTFPMYNSVDDGYKYTSPVGIFGKSPLGLEDMAGNVWEWCSDWKDLSKPDKLKEKIQKGGSFLCDTKVCHGYTVYGSSGSTPETSLMHVGFRCAMDAE